MRFLADSITTEPYRPIDIMQLTVLKTVDSVVVCENFLKSQNK